MRFRPRVGEELVINGVTYCIAEHPAAPGIPYGQAGRRAIVYQIAAGDDKRALKVFSRRFRSPALVLVAQNLAPFASLPGLRVCQREVITPEQNPDLLRQHPDLAYAVLMPWVEGPTWTEVMIQKRPFSPEEGLALARSLVSVLARMGEEGLAHCDLSGPNVILPPDGGVELVDVEEMHGPEFERPEVLSSGSGGYAHRSVEGGVWGLEGDRFAGAVMLAEMLGWCDERVRGAAWGESYFAPKEVQEEGERYELLVEMLEERWGEGVARLFERAWGSEQLADCPTFGEWVQWLPEEVGRPVVIETEVDEEVAEAAGPPWEPVEEEVVADEDVQRRLVEAKLKAGEAWLAAGQPERAAAELEEAYELDPEAAGEALARALAVLAGEREEERDREGALAAYRRVLEVVPEEEALRDEVEAILAGWEGEEAEEADEEQQVALREAEGGKPHKSEMPPRHRVSGWVWAMSGLAVLVLMVWGIYTLSLRKPSLRSESGTAATTMLALPPADTLMVAPSPTSPSTGVPASRPVETPPPSTATVTKTPPPPTATPTPAAAAPTPAAASPAGNRPLPLEASLSVQGWGTSPISVAAGTTIILEGVLRNLSQQQFYFDYFHICGVPGGAELAKTHRVAPYEVQQFQHQITVPRGRYELSLCACGIGSQPGEVYCHPENVWIHLGNTIQVAGE
ncbi:MAG TPA: hypothetical protein ENI37_00775 [Chloroflexi bacterium]|nr:hypothetical protein [Chloroflexota bacterium]